MKRLVFVSLLIVCISYTAGAMGHFHRSPHHHGHYHHHHTRLTTPEEQKPGH